ncbi:MAG TPA: hypothetical protein DCS24_02175 [Erythrobacter sp.]|nr:hypothetical protein [Erythrobacter sp.]
MQAYRLIPHPSNSPLRVSGIEARLKNSDPNWLTIRWKIDDAARLVVPPTGGKKRSDELWKRTCFEIFLKPSTGDSYQEWNFSPSRQWNAYAFEGYRDGMRVLEVSREPDSVWHGGNSFALFDVSVPRVALPRTECAIAISAVIEEEERMSYWSIAHPDTARPDFHHSACYAGLLDPRGE